MKKLKEQIYTILSTDSALQTLIGGTTLDPKIYPVLSDQFENFPCITYEELSSPYRTVPLNIYDSTFHFNIFVKYTQDDLTPDLIESIYSRVNFLLNYYVKVGYDDIVYVIQEDASDLNEKDRLLFRKLLRYRIYARNT